MADKKKKPVKRGTVAKAVKAFLKRESKPRKAAANTASKEPLVPKRPVAKRSEPLPRSAAAPAREPEQKTRVKRAAAGKNGSGKVSKAAHSTFVSPQSPLTGPKYFFHTDVPDSYNDTYMRAMPRDPEWLFVYWEISEPFRESLKRKMGDAAFQTSKKLLRICDVTDIDYNGSNAQRYTDIEINDYANNWYVRVPESGRAYVVECGFLTSDGKFYLAVRSNVVNVPHYGLSSVRDGEWNSANTDELLRMSAAGLKRGLGASEKRFSVTAENAETPESIFGLAAGSGSGMFGMPGSRM
jgi:hypothetical protein